MFSYKSRYCVAAAMAAMAALTGHVEARDIDLQSIGYFQFSPLPPTLVSETDTLLLSDSPEYVGPVGGTLSAGTINGNGRIYFYHVNEMDQPHKIAIVLENQTAYPNTVHVMRQLKSVATPDYFAAGRDLSRKDLEQPLNESPNARPLYSLSIPPQGRKLIFSDLENTPVYKDALFTGIVDIKTEAPVFARVMMLPMGMDAVDASHWAKNLPIDEIQLRGTYTGSKRSMEVTTPFDTTLGGAFVEIGNDREDMFINGVDEMQNKAFVRNRGNYGVSYTLKIPTKGNEPFRLYFNPLGGSYSGSFTVKALHQQGARRGQTDTRTYHIGGADGISALGDGTILDSRLMGNYNAGDLLTLNFMPAGASNLPIRFLLIPESLANPQKHQTIAVNVPKDVKDSLGHPTQGGTQIPVGPIGSKDSKDSNKGVVDTTKSSLTPSKQAENIAHEETKKLSDKAAAEAKKEAQLKKSKEAEEALARKKAEEAKLAAEKAEMARKAAEAKHAEIERKMAEKAEADRKAAELKAAQEAQAAKEKAALEAKKAELARIEAARKAEAERLEAARKAEAARIAAEEKRLEDERRIEAARVEAARKAEEARKAAEAKARFEAQRAAEKAALEAKRAEEERLAAEAKARLEAQRKAEQEALEARRAEEARKAAEAKAALEAQRAAEQAALEAKRQEDARRAAEAKAALEAQRIEAARKAEEARRAEEARKAEEARIEAARKAEEARLAAEAKRAEEARKAEEARIEAARKAEQARLAEEARKAEQERLAAERAEAERQAAEARRIAEERYQAHLEAERKAEAARQQALAQAEIERKAKERAEAIQRVKEQQENARRRAELARQQIEEERKAAQAAKTGPSFKELDDIHEDTPNVTIPNAVSIDELTKPRPTASQNTRRRDQRQPQVPQDQQYVQVNPMPTAPVAPLAPQNEEQNPPRIYPLG